MDPLEYHDRHRRSSRRVMDALPSLLVAMPLLFGFAIPSVSLVVHLQGEEGFGLAAFWFPVGGVLVAAAGHGFGALLRRLVCYHPDPATTRRERLVWLVVPLAGVAIGVLRGLSWR